MATMKTLNGYGFDSAKLGGKAPEYYIQPRNLLDNSDFTNPVNQRGATSYTGAGYTIDRWENNSAACKLTVEDGYIHMQNNSGSTSTATQFIRQKIENPSALIGKTITIAARVKGNCRLGCEGIGLAYPSYVNCADWTTITLTVDISTMTGDYIAAVLQGPNKSEWYCSWIALYKGSYTAETLPPYVPKGKHVEMLNCGVSLAPHNLFDNSDFRNPVNQRGINTAANNSYIIDRWLFYNSNFTGNVTITQSANGITITNDSSADTVAMVQRFIDKSYYDGKYTVVVKTTDGLVFGYTETVGSENGIAQASIWLPSGTTVVWAALYEGSYTADTLPPYVPKGKHVEMLNCGVSLTPHNLLDNSDFRNPVNQRGKTSYSGGYGIDRWKQWSSSHTTTINDNSISISIIQQYIGSNIDFDKTYTIAAKKVDGSILCEIGTFNGKLNKNGLRIDYDTNTDGTKKPYIAINEAGDYVWAALYEGSYTADTLPPYVPKGYAAEFAECRRYYKRFTAPYAGIAGTGYVTGSTKYIYIDPPDNYPMRINKPSFAFKGVINVRGINGYIVEDYRDAVIRVYENATGCIPTLEIVRGDSAAWNATNNTPVAVQFHANSVLELIADL